MKEEIWKHYSYLLSIDPSLKSTGWVLFCNETKSMIDFGVIKTEPENYSYEEDRLIYISNTLMDTTNNILKIDMVIEGLAFGAKNAKKDEIDGLHWWLRICFRLYQPGLIGVIPVEEWRGNFSTKDEKKAAKARWKKDPLKKMMVEKLPKYIDKKFRKYIKENKYSDESIYDLTDAYFLGLYRLSLNE